MDEATHTALQLGRLHTDLKAVVRKASKRGYATGAEKKEIAELQRKIRATKQGKNW